MFLVWLVPVLFSLLGTTVFILLIHQINDYVLLVMFNIMIFGTVAIAVVCVVEWLYVDEQIEKEMIRK